MTRARNPLPQLVPDRLKHLIARVEALVVAARTALPVLAAPVLDGLLPAAQAARQRFTTLEPGSWFGPAGGGWQSRWAKVKVPAAKAGERGRRHLRWDCDGEATVYRDGKPWAGLDVAHRTCPLPDGACTLLIEIGTWQTGIWFGAHKLGADGLRFRAAEVVVRDPLAWDCHHDLDTLAMLTRRLLADHGFVGAGEFGLRRLPDAVDPLLRRLLRRLDDAADAFDRGGLTGLKPVLAALLGELKAAPWQPRAARIGHAHIDLVWLWPESVTERKGAHTFATVLRLMERYPEFRFTQSQPALYRAMERLEPKLMAEVKARIRDGRWEVQGGFEVEPDTHMPCGEALARSLALGQAKTADLRGTPSRLCWIPDVFGYSAALPQILKLGGVEWFYTTKMTWSAVTRFPYNSFVWRGADGSEILTHLCTTGYNGNGDASVAIDALRDHRQADVHPAQLLAEGYGDGGGGPTELALERVRRCADLAAVPRSGWQTGEGFFADLERVREDLPVYQGELYLEYHRGTFTTQARYKAWFRGLERALQTAEAVRVVTGAGPVDDEHWQRLAFGQFHDAIPGSSIGIVYEQLNDEFAGRATALLGGAAAELAATGDHAGVLVFNPLPLARRVVVEVPGAHRGLALPDGTPVPVQAVGHGRDARTLAAVELPELGSVRLVPGPALAAEPIAALPDLLDNGLVQAAFDRDGRLVRLVVDGLDVGLDGPAWLRWYIDQPAHFDAWDIDHAALSTPAGEIPGVRLSVVAYGPARAVLEGRGSIGGSPFTIRYVLDAGARWLGVELDIDWSARHRLLKFHCPTTRRGRFARFGTPFGSVLRPQHAGVPADEAQWEVPMSRWCAVTDDDGTGLAVVSEAKYGVSCRDGDLGLSLLRAPTSPDPEADQGRQVMRFALGRHRDTTDGDRVATAAAADICFTAPLVVDGGSLQAPPFALAELGSLVPAWVKPDADGFTLRLHECSGRRGSAVLRLAATPARVELVDFLDRPLGKPLAVKDRTVRLDYAPYQVLSVRVR